MRAVASRATPHIGSGADRVFCGSQFMKLKNLSALLVLVASPLALFASSEIDRKIEDAAKASYNFRTVLEDHVKVKASDGVVTLTGIVQDKDDRALAQDTVENLPGVTSVKNDITIKPTYPEHSDAWIAFKIRTQLLVKANVSAATTTVAVKDGAVTLGAGPLSKASFPEPRPSLLDFQDHQPRPKMNSSQSERHSILMRKYWGNGEALCRCSVSRSKLASSGAVEVLCTKPPPGDQVTRSAETSSEDTTLVS